MSVDFLEINQSQNAALRSISLAIIRHEDPNQCDGKGKTLLMYACSYQFPDSVKGLIDAGADTNAADENGKTALMCTAETGYNRYTKAAEILLDAGANINAKDLYGNTALQFAAITGDRKFLKLLLSRGADIDSRNSAGKTLLIDASDNYHTSQAEMLLAAGADMNIADNNGRTPLMYAASHDYQTVKLLIKRGADVFAADSQGNTAEDICRRSTMLTDARKNRILKALETAMQDKISAEKRKIDADNKSGGGPDADFEI